MEVYTLMDELKIAKEIVKNGPGQISDDVKLGLGVKEFGKIWTFVKEEFEQLRSMKELVNNYLACSSPKRPLCLTVFGPPGSGKSFAVNEIRGAVGSDNFFFETINLTQIQSDHELSQSLTNAIKEARQKIPFIFFDEFDASRNGSALNWLSWFLAPMHDSTYILDGDIKKIDKAIFFFAGGTASDFDEFSENKTDEFKKAKGPDFLSRLRGYLNVCGPNDPKKRMIRRSIIIRGALERRAEVRSRPKSEGLEIADDLLTALLQVGRYRHGARSIEAIIESSNTAVSFARLTELKRSDLPADHIIDIHVDRGPFDPMRIGGYIQFSGGAIKDEQKKYEEMWIELAEELWKNGACIAYGGAWDAEGKYGNSLTTLLIDKAEQLPQPLCKDIKSEGEYEVNEASELICFRLFTPNKWEDVTGKTERVHKNSQKERVDGANGNDHRKLEILKETKKEIYANESIEERVKKSICYFRMRWQISEESVMLVAIGGKTISVSGKQDEGYKGRFPGIAEEIMCALVQGKPIYLCGGFGGMVKELGGLLGLVSYNGIPQSLVWSKNSDESTHWETFAKAIDDFKEVFRPPTYDELPLDDRELIDFIKIHAINGKKWPSNGLNVKENRRLFQTTDIKEACKLIKKGITKLFGAN